MWDRIKLLTSDVWQHLQPVLVLFLTTLGKQILLSAIGAVTKAAAQPNMSGARKREYAADLIRAEVEGAGTKAINLAIEIAVAKISQ